MPNFIFIVAALIGTAFAASIQPRVVSEITFPFTAAIFQPALSGYSNPLICSGALVSKNSVLTSAECVNGLDASNLGIRLGDKDSNYVNHTVTNITTHPSFNPVTLQGNLAVLRLSKNVTDIEPAKFAKGLPSPDHNTVFLLGWGPEHPGDIVSHMIRYIPVYAIQPDLCRRAFGSCYNLTTDSFCTQSPDRGAGVPYGVYGGPVINDNWTFVGIVSGNPACPAYKQVALQVNIFPFKKWIQEQADIDTGLGWS